MMQKRKETGKRLKNFRLFISVLIVSILIFVIYINIPSLSIPSDSKDSLLQENPIAVEKHESVLSSSSSVASTKTYKVVAKKRIAYAITVTKDGSFLDGALVLGHAARKVHDVSQGYMSQYDADLVAFVAPGVVTARPILTAYGWKVLEKQLPVELAEIENRDYADKMKNSGCCGADEFLKLWAYTLTEYHRVVHLDMDSIIFKSMVR